MAQCKTLSCQVVHCTMQDSGEHALFRKTRSSRTQQWQNYVVHVESSPQFKYAPHDAGNQGLCG